jgi:tetratricopeptide (TPR) repeat protein
MDVEALYQEGFRLRCDGRYGEARQALERVLTLDPRHVKARHQIGLILGFEGDFEGSAVALQQLATEVPRDADVLYDLAMTQMMLGLMDEACANLKAVLAIDPVHENALRQAAYC